MQKTLIHLTDAHIDDTTALQRGAYPRRNLEETLEHCRRNGNPPVIFTGAIGEKAAYEWFFEKIGETDIQHTIVLGNDDDYEEASRHYDMSCTDGMGELYHTREDDHYKYIFLDSSSSTVSDVQLEWLEEQLETPKKIILFIHHPVLEVETGIDKVYPLQGREKINSLLQMHGNKVTLFCGHYHMPDKKTEGNITQYITPSLAFQVKKESPTIEINIDSFAYREIILTPDGIRTKLWINYGHGFQEEI